MNHAKQLVMTALLVGLVGVIGCGPEKSGPAVIPKDLNKATPTVAGTPGATKQPQQPSAKND
jgi:hypothetical protein